MHKKILNQTNAITVNELQVNYFKHNLTTMAKSIQVEA